MRKTSRDYFTEETEKYVILYNNSTDEKERQEIFTEHLYYPFYKLAENIIHTFKFYYTDTDTIEDLKLDLVRIIWEEKMAGFNPDTGAKAYSYYGTIIKRTLIGYCKKNYSKLKKQVPIDFYVENDAEGTPSIETAPTLTLSAYMDNWIAETYRNLNVMFPKESDRVIADAVLTIFKTRQDLQIFQKKALYVYIREITGCETLFLTKVIRKLRESFFEKYKQLRIEGVVRFESDVD